MRELKFRAWFPDGKIMFVPEVITDHQQAARTEDGAMMTYGGETWGYPDTIIIMQYTGLHDKNGKEIYEGDILAWPELTDIREVVKWKEIQKRGTYGHGDYGISSTIGFYFDGYIGTPETAEVIGNIYENPELIERG